MKWLKGIAFALQLSSCREEKHVRLGPGCKTEPGNVLENLWPETIGQGVKLFPAMRLREVKSEMVRPRPHCVRFGVYVCVCCLSLCQIY